MLQLQSVRIMIEKWHQTVLLALTDPRGGPEHK